MSKLKAVKPINILAWTTVENHPAAHRTMGATKTSPVYRKTCIRREAALNPFNTLQWKLQLHECGLSADTF